MEEIKIENLTFTYPERDVPAVENISLTINQGEFVVICGKSGCGKSTLLRQIKPILAPNGSRTGKIYINGAEVEALSQREQAEKIGFVLQSPDNQLVCDKVWHELAFGLESLSYTNTEIRARVAEMASFFGIQEWFYKNVTDLSGGQKQLLNLAAVMVMQPSVLILDEPTSQLDPIAAHDFLKTLSKINKELGTTIILTEHRTEEAFPLADKVVVLEGGHIIAKGSPREIGEALKDNDMFVALPTPMRVFCAAGKDGDCPVTVREGRNWLLGQEICSDIPLEEKPPVEADTALAMTDVWFRYEKDLPDVLKGISLKVHEGEFYAIVGGNGAGKTTALSVMADINKPYRGKVRLKEGKKIAMLPQNPVCLFSRKTVLLELKDMLSDLKISGEEKEERLNSVISLCELDGLLNSHPYDLSGGEQQRAAMAMVLLKAPDIILLDEPTKGLDAHFKLKLAKLLLSLKKSGIAIIMVSHDVEFCAKYADCCGMMFDGQIVSEDAARKFFAGKSFYTTAANRMARSVLPNAVTDTDIIKALGADFKEKAFDYAAYKLPPSDKKQEKKQKRLSTKNIIMGIVFFALFIVSLYFYFQNTSSVMLSAVSIVFLGLSCFNLIPQREFGIKIQAEKNQRKIPKRTLAAAIMILLLIPLTLFIGIYYLGDRKYYFISLLIILETMLPFALIFEGRKPQARELVIISVLCAAAVIGRAAFIPLPQFKPATAIVIITGICFGGEAGFLVGAITGFVSNFFFGQGPWTPWQMFALGMIGFVAGILFKKGIVRKTKLELSIFGFLGTVLIYGGIMNPASVIMWQANPNWDMIKSAYIMGLPFDLVHAVSTVFFLWLCAEPVCEKLERIKIKYGLVK